MALSLTDLRLWKTTVIFHRHFIWIITMILITTASVLMMFISPCSAIITDISLPKRIDPSFFTDFDNIRDKIAMKLIHYERNKELLEKVPHIPFPDLAIVFYWSDLHGFYDWQCNNPDPSFPFKELEYHNDRIVSDRQRQYSEDFAGKTVWYEWCHLWIIRTAHASWSNRVQTISLSNVRTHKRNEPVWCYMSALQRSVKAFFWRITDWFLYLQPSIHEVILVPTLENDCYGELSDMVREVNDSQLMDDEILSTHAYYYSRRKNEITM